MDHPKPLAERTTARIGEAGKTEECGGAVHADVDLAEAAWKVTFVSGHATT
jgi:hypothetical protein